MDFVRGFCHGVTAVFGAASNSDSARRFYRVFLGVTGTFWLSRLTGLFFFVCFMFVLSEARGSVLITVGQLCALFKSLGS